MKEEAPDIMTMNDTALKGKMKVQIPNYFSFVKNREKNKGGVATVIANYLKPNTMKVTEGREGDEYIVTRFDNTTPPINVVNIYGQQEAKTDNDEIEKSWLRLMEDVKDIENRNEAVLIIGDLNRAIGNDEYGVQGNKSKTSFGGRLIRDLIKNQLYIVINNLDITKGGPWTWVDRQDNKIKSCLDIGIMSVSLQPYLTKVIVDTDRKFTPKRVITRKKIKRNIFSDHYSLKIEFKGIPRKQEENKQETTWNRGRPGGWETYQRITDDVADKVSDINEKEDDIDKVMKQIDAIENKTKFKAFGKTKSNVKKKPNPKQCRCNPGRSGSCEECKKKDDEIQNKITQKIEAQEEKIKTSSHGRSGNVFRIRNTVLGPKKGGQEASAIKDPDTGDTIVNKEDIKKATLKYCVNNLKNNTPDEEEKDNVKKRKEDQLEIMNDKNGESFEITYDDFDQVLAKFEMKETKTYDFLIKAGKKYKYALFEVCKRIIDKEEIPDSFHKTILYMLWKRRGLSSILKNNRFLHLRQVLARTVDALVVRNMREPLISKLSIYQVGGLPGHSILEHLLTIKTVLARFEELGQGIIFLVMDIVSFFDKEDIFDCLETMKELKINKKATRLWYLLNRDTRIQVKTAFGLTEEEEVGDCLAQGTAGAGLISAANLDLGLQKKFNASNDSNTINSSNNSNTNNTSNEVLYFGDIRIQPLAYQDDVGSICQNVDMVRNQASKLTKMLSEKTLEAHENKSGVLILGSRKFQKKITKEIEENPIDFNKFNLNIKTTDKYLGQIFQSNLSESALATVQERAGKIKGAAMEAKAIIEDFQMKAMGGLVAAWELWERAILPSLLSGAGTWLGEVSEAIKLCNKLQGFYWRVILKVPESCPKLALLCETKMTDMKYRIWEEKCLLLSRVHSLEEGSLAKSIYEVAEENGWPGLGRDVRQICEQIQIPDLNKYNQRKQEIKKAIAHANYESMMQQFEGSRKLEDIKFDDFTNMQEYFNDRNLERARMKFKIRTKMVETIPCNFKNKYKNVPNGLKCKFCPDDMTQNHCLTCQGREQLREDLDITQLDDLVIYFQRILKEKDNKN